MDGRLLLNAIVSKSAVIIQLIASKDEALLFRPSAILLIDHHLTLPMVSVLFTSRVRAFPVIVFAKICIVPLGDEWRTRRRVASFQMLFSAKVRLSSSCFFVKEEALLMLGEALRRFNLVLHVTNSI